MQSQLNATDSNVNEIYHSHAYNRSVSSSSTVHIDNENNKATSFVEQADSGGANDDVRLRENLYNPEQMRYLQGVVGRYKAIEKGETDAGVKEDLEA